jgi:hydroxymethylbilane synthase
VQVPHVAAIVSRAHSWIEVFVQADSVLRVGTRGSALALWQAERVKQRLEAAHTGLRCELVAISTQGDRDKVTPLAVIGGQGIFTKEVQIAVLEGTVDCAVHSLKDLPSLLPEGLMLAAVLERDDPRDVFVSASYASLLELPEAARVGTSSRRRMAQLLEQRPDLEVIELRGNVDTRMRKVLEGSPEGYQGAVLAAAGLARMGWSERIASYLDLDAFTPAPGQAALAVDCRADDERTLGLLRAVNDPETMLLTGMERSFLRAVGGGCRAPIAAYAERVSEHLRLHAMVASEDLRDVRRATCTVSDSDAEHAASELARELLASVMT